MKYTDLKTFEDACKVEGLDAGQLINALSLLPEKEKNATEAFVKLSVVARAANRLENDGQEWKPDWSDHDQWKYYPWFEMGGSSGFRFGVCGRWCSCSCVCSRLCFISYEVAEHIGRQFTEMYKSLMVIE
jgi:hypothetical protein